MICACLCEDRAPWQHQHSFKVRPAQPTYHSEQAAKRTVCVFVFLARTSSIVSLYSSVDHVPERLVQADREVVGLSHKEVDAEWVISPVVS